MFCPNCGAQGKDGSQYCRGCGTNLDVVSKALTGGLVPAQSNSDAVRQRNKSKATASGISQITMGFAFVFVSLVVMMYAPAGRIWWFWMLIPAFAMFGQGVAKLLEASRIGAQLPPAQAQAPAPQPQVLAAPPNQTAESSPTQRYEVAPPPSVVEATTRQLDRNRE